MSSNKSSCTNVGDVPDVSQVLGPSFGDKALSAAASRLDIVQPLFHRAMRLNLSPSAFDETDCPMLQHSPSPCNAKSSIGSVSPLSPGEATAQSKAQRQGSEGTPATPSSITSNTSAESIHRSDVSSTKLPQPCKEDVQKGNSATLVLETEHLPLVDLAAALVVISDDPLLSTGAYLPAAPRPTTPSTPATPCSVINLSTATSACMPPRAAPPAAALCTTTAQKDATAEADNTEEPAQSSDVEQATDAAANLDSTTEVTRTASQCLLHSSAAHAAAQPSSAQEASSTPSRQFCSAVCTTVEGTVAYETSRGSDAEAPCATAPGECLSKHQSLKSSSDWQHATKEEEFQPVLPVYRQEEPNTGPCEVSSNPITSEAVARNPVDYISLPASPAAVAAASQPPLRAEADHSTTQEDSEVNPSSNQGPLTPLPNAKHPPAPEHVKFGYTQTFTGSEAFSGPSYAPLKLQRHIWRPPKLLVSHTSYSTSVSGSIMPPGSSNATAAPSAVAAKDFGVSHSTRSNSTSAASSPRTCEPPSASSSAALPVMHRTTSTGSCVSSSNAPSDATVTPYSWLPYSRPHSRMSSATTISTVADVSGSLPPPKQRHPASKAASISLDTLTLTPSPAPLLPVTGTPDCLLGSDSNQELSSQIPIAPPVTPNQSSGSFFHLPDSHSGSGALSGSLAEESASDSAVIARLLSPAAVEYSSAECAADKSVEEEIAAPFVSPFRHAPSWSTSSTMNIPRYPLSKLATMPVPLACQPPSTGPSSIGAAPLQAPDESISFEEASRAPVSMEESWATVSLFPRTHTPVLCHGPNAPASPRSSSSPGSSVAPSSPQVCTASPGSPDTITSVSSHRSPLEFSEPSLMQDGYLHIPPRHIDWDVSSPHPSDAPSTPFSNISIGTPSSCSSGCIGHACRLSPRGTESPVAKALEYITSPLRDTDSDDSAGGDVAESPATPADMAGLSRVQLPFVGDLGPATETTPQRAGSPLQTQHDTAPQVKRCDDKNYVPQQPEVTMQQVPAQACNPPTTRATASHGLVGTSLSSQIPLLDSISEEIDVADARLKRGHVWAHRRELPISQPQTLTDSPPPSPPIHDNPQSDSKERVLPCPVPEPFVHSVQHRKSLSMPDSSNLDSMDFTDYSGLMNVADEITAVEQLLHSLDREPAMQTSWSQQPTVTCRVTIRGTRGGRKVLDAVPQSGFRHAGVSRMEPSTDLSSATDSSCVNSSALLLNAAPVSHEPHWRAAQHCSGCQETVISNGVVRGRRFERYRSAQKCRCPSLGSDSENCSRQSRWNPAAAFSRTVSSSPGVCEDCSSTVKAPGRLSRLARRARGASAPTWLSRAWAGGSSEKQSAATVASSAIPRCCNNDGFQPSKISSKSVPSNWDSSKGERSRLSRPSVQALPSKPEGHLPRRKLSLRPELLQYMSNRASSFLCGVGMQEPKVEC